MRTCRAARDAADAPHSCESRAVLPARLLQTQRDYVGAHTCERGDKPRGEFFRNNRAGRDGATSSSTYNV